MTGLQARNETLAITVNNFRKANLTVFRSCPILLWLSILSKIVVFLAKIIQEKIHLILFLYTTTVNLRELSERVCGKYSKF